MLGGNISVRYEENNGKNGLMKILILHAATWKDDSSDRSRVPSAFSDLYSALLLSLLSHSLFHHTQYCVKCYFITPARITSPFPH